MFGNGIKGLRRRLVQGLAEVYTRLAITNLAHKVKKIQSVVYLEDLCGHDYNI